MQMQITTKKELVEFPIIYRITDITFKFMKENFNGGVGVSDKVIPVRNWLELKRIPAKTALLDGQLLKWIINGQRNINIYAPTQSQYLAKEYVVKTLDKVEDVVICPNNDFDAIVTLTEEPTYASKVKFIDPIRIKSFKNAYLLVTRYTPANMLVNFLYNGGGVAKFALLPPKTVFTVFNELEL